jgi:uncharacterized repeat protein (TIGR03803 family)
VLPGTVSAVHSSSAHGYSYGYKVLYSFTAKPLDAVYPQAGLVDVNGMLYGATINGGKYGAGFGAVYSITPSGEENVLHDFGNGVDGKIPEDSLIGVNETLYGTTQQGGKYQHGSAPYYHAYAGTVFSITPSGQEKVLHNFGKGSDGSNPYARLHDLNGTLYGTTQTGGAFNYGTVFSITLSGKEKVLHSFGYGADGSAPVASLTDVEGTLYGTTEFGGRYGKGTVFSITRSGKEKVLHSFAGAPNDGSAPVAGLIYLKGTLYGTTAQGGRYTSYPYFGGTVFSITPSGKEKVLHSFMCCTDGELPESSLINVGGTLYGTTYGGGSGIYGWGTVFSITTSGQEKVLHGFPAFQGDGCSPDAKLVNMNGTLYGTTYHCGQYAAGTVFSISP